MSRGGVASGFDRIDKGFQRSGDAVTAGHEIFDKTGGRLAQAEQVVQDQHLPISAGAGADADDRYL